MLDGMTLMWIQVATGFTGALTLVFLGRKVLRRLGWIMDLQVYFSPKGGCQDAVVRELQRARREVLVQVSSFSAEPLVKALVDAKTRGVNVDLVLDAGVNGRAAELGALVEAGLDPRLDSDHALARMNLILIDGRVVITGSFDFTAQGEYENAESVLVIKGHPDLPGFYRANFLQHKAHSKAVESKPELKLKAAA